MPNISEEIRELYRSLVDIDTTNFTPEQWSEHLTKKLDLIERLIKEMPDEKSEE